MSQRMVHSVSTRIFLGLLPLLAATAFAQDTLEEEVPEVRRYTVEMIIFAYEQNVASGSEIFVPDEPPPIDPLLAGEIVDDRAQHPRGHELARPAGRGLDKDDQVGV